MKIISTLMIGLITSVAAMNTMAAPAIDQNHHTKSHKIKKQKSLHQAGFKHIRAAKHIDKEEYKSFFKKHHNHFNQDFRADFRVKNKSPFISQPPKL